MEKAAYDQLQGQAKQHENAQFIIREKLNKSLITIKEFKILVKVRLKRFYFFLVHSLLSKS